MRTATTASLAGLLVLAFTGCVRSTDPTIACGALTLGTPDRAVVTRSATVLAFTELDGRVTIVRDRCPDSEACSGPDEIEIEPLELAAGMGSDGPPDRILLSGTGDWLSYIDAGSLRKIDLACDRAAPGCRDPAQVEALSGEARLVGTLRSGDWVLVRDDYGLRAIDLAAEEGERDAVVPLGEDPDLWAVSLGDRSLVARRIVSGGEEELYLIRVNPTRWHDAEGPRGEPIFLGRGPAFSRVLITRGPTPNELGELDEADPDVPIDAYVVATAGAGQDAHTVVFRVLDGEPVDSFPGAAVSSHVPLEEIAGLSAVSPDGSHLAYVTPSGALALRGVGSQGACLVRSATEGSHSLAGFSADGTLYFEAGGPDDPLTEGLGAYDPRRGRLSWLARPGEPSTLKAAPLRPVAGDGGDGVPWAIAARDGFFGAQPGQSPQPLGLGKTDVSFLARAVADDSMWLLQAQPADGSELASTSTRLRLRKVRAVDPGDGAPLDLEVAESDPAYKDEADELHPFERTFAAKFQICLSPARPGGWGSDCSTREDPVPFLRSAPESPE